MSTRPSKIVVINPSSSEALTARMDATLQPLRFEGSPEIECLTLKNGPSSMKTQENIESVTPSLVRLVSEVAADAFVIACYADPGLQACREATKRPVFGVHECGVLTALSRGERFGVIAIQQPAVPRHLRYMRQMGLLDRLAGERHLEVSPEDMVIPEKMLAGLIKVGRTLRDTDGADVVIMGVAGGARYRAPLEQELGVPVIDPLQAATAMAIGTLRYMQPAK